MKDQFTVPVCVRSQIVISIKNCVIFVNTASDSIIGYVGPRVRNAFADIDGVGVFGE